jgi:hypothetical protein
VRLGSAGHCHRLSRERATLSFATLYVAKGANYVTFSNLNLVGTSASAPSIQLFGDYPTLAYDDITDNHYARSCVTAGE